MSQRMMIMNNEKESRNEDLNELKISIKNKLGSNLGNDTNVIPTEEGRKFLELGDRFYYIVEIKSLEMVYISDKVERILGYDKNEVSFNFLYDIIHPADRYYVIKATAYSADLAIKTGHTKPLQYIFSLRYRMLNKKGEYIHVLRQHCSYKTDQEGKIIYSLGVITDITYLNPDKSVKYHVSGPEAHKYDFPGRELLTSHKVFSPREIEVIHLIGKGKSSREIAKMLGLSYNTVITHRQNMLRKVRLKNTAELLMYAKENGFI